MTQLRSGVRACVLNGGAGEGVGEDGLDVAQSLDDDVHLALVDLTGGPGAIRAGQRAAPRAVSYLAAAAIFVHGQGDGDLVCHELGTALVRRQRASALLLLAAVLGVLRDDPSPSSAPPGVPSASGRRARRRRSRRAAQGRVSLAHGRDRVEEVVDLSSEGGGRGSSWAALFQPGLTTLWPTRGPSCRHDAAPLRLSDRCVDGRAARACRAASALPPRGGERSDHTSGGMAA